MARRYHRECDRRVGHHRRRPRGARRPRRVHRQHRQLAFARRERSDLRAAVRRAEGFRTGRASAQQSLCHRGTEGPTGKQPERTDCLAQGQPGQGDTGHGRTRFGTTRQRRLLPECHRDPLPVRAVSRRLLRDYAGPALGHIDPTFDQAITALPHVRGGRVEAYAVSSNNRLAAAPDIPTVDEAGAPGVYISTWYGMWVPKGTPQEAIQS